MRSILAAGLFLVVASVAATDFYRCEVDGEKVFQDRPCDGDLGRISAEPRSTPAPQTRRDVQVDQQPSQRAAGYGVRDELRTSDAVQPRGHIRSAHGDHCDFVNVAYDDARYFFPSASGRLIVMRFEDATCMSVRGRDIAMDNRIRIAQRVGRWYSHSDADWQAYPLEKAPGPLQARGYCMRSGKYPVTVVLDFVVENGAITEVPHTMGLMNCGEN